MIEICEHGSQKSKCPYCEVIELEQKVNKLEAENAALRKVVEMVGSLKTMLEILADDSFAKVAGGAANQYIIRFHKKVKAVMPELKAALESAKEGR